jgi:hypothetical protein
MSGIECKINGVMKNVVVNKIFKLDILQKVCA